LDPEEIGRLLDNCLDDAYPVVATSVLTGMRRSEVFGLRLEDVDFEANKIRVRQTLYLRRGEPVKFVSPKSEASVRDIDMSPKLKTILLEYKLRTANRDNPYGLLFTNKNGGPVDPNNFVKRRFVPALKAAGLGHMRFHDLRHCYGSLKIEQDENLKYVQTQMGHSSIQVTLDIYSHLLKKSNPAAAEKTDALIFGTG
jgi:integrase